MVTDALTMQTVDHAHAADWLRQIERAARQGLSPVLERTWAEPVGDAEIVWSLWSVTSTSDPTVTYDVLERADKRTLACRRGDNHRIGCTCVAGHLGRPCKHAGAVIAQDPTLIVLRASR